ncbi:MAG: hypothetical protein V4568_14710 [Pseudomonadota bacterium]
MPSIDDLPPPRAKGASIDDLPPPKSEPGYFDGAVKSTINALPMIGGTIGGVLGTPADVVAGPMGNVAGAAVGGYMGTAAKNLINRYYDPENAPKNMTEVMTQPVTGGAEQAAYQATGEAATPYIARGVKAVTGPFSEALQSIAAKKAVTATGATGKQAAKFAPEAGQELLDRGIVKFGDSQAKVAEKATAQWEQASENTGKVLADLDKKGGAVDRTQVIESLRKRATELGDDESQFGVSDSLNKLADRIEANIKAGGKSQIPLTQAESIKRGFQNAANYNSGPMDLSISKEAASVYRQAVEDAATKVDPTAADAFMAEKKSYGLLKPIQDAANKRAATVAQSPHGGLLDTAAAGVGEAVGGAPAAIALPIARRGMASRIAPAMAATANTGAKIVGAVPAAVEGSAQAIPAVLRASSPGMPAALDSGVQRLIPMPAAAAAQGPSANRSPAKGEDLWAQQGAAKLGIQDASGLMNDPISKQLLIQASDLSPGSKAMKKIQDQLRQRGNR